jgi:hypothetical protein
MVDSKECKMFLWIHFLKKKLKLKANNIVKVIAVFKNKIKIFLQAT